MAEGKEVELVDLKEGESKTVNVYETVKAKAKAAYTWKICIQDLVGLVEAMNLAAFIMTWIFHYSSDTKSVLYSLMQVPLVGCMIYSLIVIPIGYMVWLRPDKIKGNTEARIYAQAKTLSNLAMGYVILELISFALAVANIIVRVILFFNPLSTVTDVRTVNLALMVLTSLDALTSLFGIIFGLAFRNALEGIVKKSNRQYKMDGKKLIITEQNGNQTQINTTTSSAHSRNRIKNFTYGHFKDDETKDENMHRVNVIAQDEQFTPTHQPAKAYDDIIPSVKLF